MLVTQHSDSPDAKGKNALWSLGEVCPDTVVLPEDWDVLGKLPPVVSSQPDVMHFSIE